MPPRWLRARHRNRIPVGKVGRTDHVGSRVVAAFLAGAVLPGDFKAELVLSFFCLASISSATTEEEIRANAFWPCGTTIRPSR
jgi:hypothetical protein